MNSPAARVYLLVLLASFAPQLACSGDGPREPSYSSKVPTPEPTPVSTPANNSGNANGNTIDGAALYATLCANCHGALASSNKRGVVAAKILDPYTKFFPTHSSIEWPDADQAAALAKALAFSTSDGS